MEPRTHCVPTRRVFQHDADAVLDGERVLALALLWGDRTLAIDQLHVGQRGSPLNGVTIDWEGQLPVLALDSGTHAWVERSAGHWVDPGRRIAVEAGDVVVAEAGGLTLEARLQRRAQRLPVFQRPQSRLFFLVMAHCLMLFIALSVTFELVPPADEDSMWSSASIIKHVVSPLVTLPKVIRPALHEQVAEVLKNRSPVAVRTKTKSTAMDALRLLFGGGGALGAGFKVGGGGGYDAALNQLQGGQNNSAGEGLGGMAGRELGQGLNSEGLGIGGVGPGRGPGRGPPGGLRGHRVEEVACKNCLANLPPGYDRDLVLKIVRRHQNEIRFCYESELATTPSLAGKVTVAWTIGPTGRVDTAQIAESGLGNARVEDCIVSRVKRWTFPEPAGGQEVAITFPWVFQVAGSNEE